ncbi:hypothetical protein BDE02_14G159800 [Populus trichocarpa]|nr:hypothetical protein BDE02_14G159800 [Populus trichocarpa]KAI5566031.1 hypothetical protein BDE02_14G159800 [Populus trichocarpa]
MHGCGPGSAPLVNAEVDSMGGVVDGGVGIDIKTSPRQAAIEKAHAELRQEYDVREERRRELEFLEKGGNPLDFKFVNAASVSVQSTSLTDHHVEQFVTSEAKGNFPLTTSLHGDSVESSGRPGATAVCEPNSADNFDGENELLEVERKPTNPSRRNKVTQSEQSSQMDGTHNAKESEDSAIFRPYARRNRSRPNRDSARSGSTDIVQSSGGHGSYLPVRGGARDVKGLVTETDNHKDQNITLVSNPKSPASNGMVSQIEASNTHSNMELDCVQALKTVANLPEYRLDVTESNVLRDNLHDQPSEADTENASKECDHDGGREQVISAGPEGLPCAESTKTENETGPGLLNGFSDLKKDGDEGQNGNTAMGTKGFDSESSCTQNSISLDVNNESDLCANYRNDDTNEILFKELSKHEGTQSLLSGNMGNEKKETKSIEHVTAINDGSVHQNYSIEHVTAINDGSVHQNYSGNDSTVKSEEEMRSCSHPQNEVKCHNLEGAEQNDHVAPEADTKAGKMLADGSNSNRENIYPSGPQGYNDPSIQELPHLILLEKKSSAALDPQSCSNTQLKLVDKAHEDSVLEEARIIEAKRKRIAELSVGTVPSKSNWKSHWDFVLEEMAWLANDFAQERLWKMTAAAQICRRVAFTSRLRVEERNQHLKLKKVAYSLAKAVMQFWHSMEVYLSNNCQSFGSKNGKHESIIFYGNEFSVNKYGEIDKVACKELEIQKPVKNIAHAIHGYALRFLKYNSSPVPSLQEVPATPDRIADLGMMDISWDDHLTEESLFYAVPSAAMAMYRLSIESHIMQSEKTHNNMQDEVDTSMYDTPADFGCHDNAYDEEEETSAYYMHGVFEGSKQGKHDQKKWKSFTKSPSARSYDLATDSPYGHCTTGPQQNVLKGKRPANNLNTGSIPTKRMRTASRQRFTSPFTAGTTGVLPQAPMKTDASSGDTNSFQDDQSTLHGGSQIQKSVEVESAADFERQLPYDYAETSAKLKKKKKAKHLGSAYEQGWQLDSTVHNDQRDNFRKRSESHHFDSNGTSGLYEQHSAKKPKIMKQLLDNTFDSMEQMTGSVPSPALSQMSKMSNTNRFIKLIGGRERGRKNKSMKMSAGQPGFGTPWSLFEDQALVVLVHDMGPNWDLISDAINSTVQFKCIFRKPKECKERHKILMDKGAGDGADSAEDSGSSQSYPSTLPGIPKGSARQLFQHLQGPMQEDTLKSHFEKIIMIGKKYLYKRSQNENQDPKQIAAIHNSHGIALSQVCPNLNGGVLMPLDLCDPSASNPDVLPIVYQGSHASNLVMTNQGAIASMLPTSGASSSLQGSSGVVLGSNSSSPFGPLNAPLRDGRYNVPRTSLPVDEQQRMQHCHQMLSNRNLQQSNLSVSGALSGADRGVHMLPGGNGMGIMPGMNRSMPLPRPGFQGIASPSMLNPGNLLSPNMVGMPSPVNMHSGTGSGQGNSMRPREAMHYMRLGHNPEHQRQMKVPELQMQATQGNNQGIPAFNGLSSAFANQMATTPVQTYPGHPQHQHQISTQQSNMLSNPHHPNLHGSNHTTVSQQQTNAMHHAKERQMQQRLLQQQQLAASSALVPHAQHQSQLPITSSMQSSSQIPSPTASQPLSPPPITPPSPMTPISMQQQQQQKHNLPHHAVSWNPQTGSSGLTNQMGKQRQWQPQQFQQSARHHPQQRQHSQSPQQAKLLKGMGRGNMVVHQNLLIDHSPLNGLSVPPGNQGAEKGEQIMHLMQGPGLYSGAGLSPIQSSKPLVSSQSLNHSQPQQKLYSGSTNPSSKPLQQMPSHLDNSVQGHVQPVLSGQTLTATHQNTPVMVPNHQHLQPHLQPHQKQVSQPQPAVQRMLQKNRQVNSDLATKPQNDQSHTDQQTPNISRTGTRTSTMTTQGCNDTANVAPVVSSASAIQWKSSESPLHDSGMENSASQKGPIGSPALTSATGSEPAVSLGSVHRQLSGGLPMNGHNGGAQWQHKQPQKSTALPPPCQQLLQPQEQKSQQEQQHSPQQLPPQQPSQL